MSRPDTISGGQFFAALRLVVHFESGKEVDQGLAFAQGMYRGRRYETFSNCYPCAKVIRYLLPVTSHLQNLPQIPFLVFHQVHLQLPKPLITEN
jgi:hypothetical protein